MVVVYIIQNEKGAVYEYIYEGLENAFLKKKELNMKTGDKWSCYPRKIKGGKI